MKQWSLFFISFGGILIMLSYTMPNPLFMIVSGLVVAGLGIIQLRKK